MDGESYLSHFDLKEGLRRGEATRHTGDMALLDSEILLDHLSKVGIDADTCHRGNVRGVIIQLIDLLRQLVDLILIVLRGKRGEVDHTVDEVDIISGIELLIVLVDTLLHLCRHLLHTEVKGKLSEGLTVLVL